MIALPARSDNSLRDAGAAVESGRDRALGRVALRPLAGEDDRAHDGSRSSHPALPGVREEQGLLVP